MPYQGMSLFGPSLHSVLQREVEASKALQGEKIFRDAPPPKPAAARPQPDWSSYKAPARSSQPPKSLGGKGKGPGKGTKRPRTNKPSHPSKKGKGSGV